MARTEDKDIEFEAWDDGEDDDSISDLEDATPRSATIEKNKDRQEEDSEQRNDA